MSRTAKARTALRNPRYQFVFLLVSLCAGGGFLWYEYRYTPRLEEISVLMTRDQTLSRANEMARSALGGDGMERIRVALDAYERQAEGIRHLLPTPNEGVSVLPVISRLVEESRVQLISFTPGAVRTEGGYRIAQYTLAIEGGYHDTGRFLAALGSLEQITRVRNHSATSSGARRGAAPNASPQLASRIELDLYMMGEETSERVGALASDSLAVSAQESRAPESTYLRDADGRLWQLLQVPDRPDPVRIPVTAAGRARAEAWLNQNP